MDLKTKDVAQLLYVSSRTIRRWLRAGKIPAYRLNNQYRFSRMEIESWMMRSKLIEEGGVFPKAATASPTPTMQQFGLFRALHRGEVLGTIPGKDKETIIRSAMDRLAPTLGLDAGVLTDLLLDRESLMSTGIGHGIAIPHTRDFLLPAAFDYVALAYTEEPIEFGSLDAEPVNTLFFLFASSNKRHLHLLAKIAHLSGDPRAREVLGKKPPKEELMEFLRGWEAEIKTE